MWYFTADLHLGHNNIIKYCNRPFMNAEELQLNDIMRMGQIPSSEVKISDASTENMDQTIIDSINSVVGLNDSLVIIGDFCFSKTKDRKKKAQNYRERINCKNVYLLYGNHDDKACLDGLFKFVADLYTFHINGQNVFCCHYPCRSWEKKAYNSWMLYGHVHGKLAENDIGKLNFEQLEKLKIEFVTVTEKFNVNQTVSTSYLEAALAFLHRHLNQSLTLDVGVDNRLLCNNKSFGTPWSFSEIEKYMSTKLEKVNEK